MARWFSKRWVWAAMAGTTMTVGLATSRADGDGPPKVGTVMSLNVDGKGERQFKVVKSEKQPDGSYLSELKDTKTGETITLLDKPGTTLPPGTKDAPRSTEPLKKARANDPMLPSLTAPTTPPPKPPEKEKEKHPILNRIFGDRDKDKTPAANMPGPTSSAKVEPDSDKRPGPLARLFGAKKPTGPSMPAATMTPTSPVAKPSSSAPPPVLPTPPGGLSGTTSPPSGSTAEPPRVMPGAKPVAPPVPFFPPPPVKAPPMVPAPTFPTPPGLAIPTPPPAPVPVPAIPAPPGGGYPPIPVPPGGTSSARPIQITLPVGYVPAPVAFDREVQPFVIALQAMSAPSARLTAALGLAEGRHCSTEGVKIVLFQAAQMDPCGEVRAACIGHLCKLGYFNPQFLGYIQAASEDTDPQVRDAAKAACAKMIRR